MFPTNSEFLIGISDALIFCLFYFTAIRHLPHALTVTATKVCLLCATPAGMDRFCPHCRGSNYILHYIQVHARRYIPSAVPCISEDCLLPAGEMQLKAGALSFHDDDEVMLNVLRCQLTF